LEDVFAAAVAERACQLPDDAEAAGDAVASQGVGPPLLGVVRSGRFVVFGIERENDLNGHRQPPVLNRSAFSPASGSTREAERSSRVVERSTRAATTTIPQ